VQEIEQRAESVLAGVPDWIWNGETLPVPVDDIADSCFGLLIRDVEDMTAAPGAPELPPGQSISGLLLAGPGEIWVNAAEAREWPPRRRFTIGHELGHWVMHRRPGQQSLFCRHGSIEPTEKTEDSPTELTVEDEANIFSAALTMPSRLIREHYERLRHEPDCHERMCQLFAASGAAMGKRLHTAI
jgi:IrrE N-terminal-like domain